MGVTRGLSVFSGTEPQMSSREHWKGELAGLRVCGSPALASDRAAVWGRVLYGCSFSERKMSILHACRGTSYASGIVPGAGATRMTKTQCPPSGSLKCPGGDRDTDMPAFLQLGQGLGGRGGQSPQKTDCIYEPWCFGFFF